MFSPDDIGRIDDRAIFSVYALGLPANLIIICASFKLRRSMA
jgi:hypothetical protein